MLRWGDPAPGKELEGDGYLGLDGLDKQAIHVNRPQKRKCIVNITRQSPSDATEV